MNAIDTHCSCNNPTAKTVLFQELHTFLLSSTLQVSLTQLTFSLRAMQGHEVLKLG